jgi:serine/threonine protein phosphatase PrpC
MTQHEQGRAVIEAGARVQPGQRALILTEPVHSAARSRRWRARDAETDEGGFELLFLAPDDPGGPLLAPQGELAVCGWECARGDHGGWRVLLFREAHLTPLSAEMTAPAPGDEARAHRLRVALALGELFEMLHVLGEAAVIHSELGAFALRADRDAPEAVMRWPELLYPLSSPPEPGSFTSTGLDAPEVTGLVVRPVDQRADVYSLGVLIWSILSGVRPEPGLEALLDRLPPLRAFDPGLPLGVEPCVLRALARTPEARYDSVTDFLAALRAALRDAAARRVEGPDRPCALRFASATDIGNGKWSRQRNNQDEHLAIWDPVAAWGLFAVLDGVSRSEIGSGDLASWAARQSLESQWSAKRGTPIFGQRFEGDSPFPRNLLETMIRRAHEQVVSWARLLAQARQSNRPGMTACSTVSLLGLFGDRALLCALGDSPVFLLHRGPDGALAIERLTWAQTLSAEAVRRGLSLSVALGLSRGKALSEALGRATWDSGQPEPLEINPTSTWLRVQPGDLFLLTTDGIPDALGLEAERVILQLLSAHLPPGPRSAGALFEAARALIDEANRRGARDNLTALLVAIEEIHDGTPGAGSSP